MMLTRRDLAVSAFWPSWSWVCDGSARLNITAPSVVSPVPILGRVTLTYELLILNRSEKNVRLRRLVVFDSVATRPIAFFFR